MVASKIKITAFFLLGLTNGVHGFGHTPLRRDRTTWSICSERSDSKADNSGKTAYVATDASKGGAGSWRAKAKEFQKGDGSEADKSNRKLEIAFVTGNAMKQKEINMILASNVATAGPDGQSYVNLRILDVDLPEIQGALNLVRTSFPFLM